ncbi:DUF2934 domain-containing protein [Paraburkholderia sp. SIMBA_009]|uniref:DUF2934 domain-containing protein n=1 Tax=Paraburkholderia tropica TaxID=92647 RepID=A0AAQ1GNC8_9BURK|nr:DUF2934 domain-containing protein [Paraburkholderia tropica]RQN34340.1 DUF2934 domain-containing protein [Paraburkholderia tropica]SEK14257.1 Protein of unknown function [Paraburkholderia tropica]
MHSNAGQFAGSPAKESSNASNASGWPGKPGPKSGDQSGTDRLRTADYDEITDRVRERAYQLWQAAGSPENCADDFWYEAEKQLRAVVVSMKEGQP